MTDASRVGQHLLAVGALLVCLLTAAAAPAAASCAATDDDPTAGARSVFVGTVEVLRQRGSIAVVAVDEVWKGPDLAPTVGVIAGQRQPPFPLSLVLGVGGSSDVHLVRGRRYLFVIPRDVDGFRIDACSMGDVDPTAVRFPPSDARAPVAGGYAGVLAEAGAAPGLPLAATAAGLLAAGVAALGWRRRRGPQQGSGQPPRLGTRRRRRAAHVRRLPSGDSP